MGIRKKGYYPWNGELIAPALPWWPIFRQGLKTLKKRIKQKLMPKLLMGFCFMLFLVFLAALYISTKPELKMLSDLVRLLQSDAAIFFNYYVNPFMIMAMIFVSLFSGSELISRDLQSNSLTLYLSRPLSRWDYIIGKFSIVLFYLLLLTLVPGLLLLVAKFVFTGHISIPPLLLLASILFPLAYALFFASSILFASSLSKNQRFVKIVFVLLFFASQPVSHLLVEIFHSQYFMYLSLMDNLRQFGALVFQQKAAFSAPLWPSGAITLGLTSFFILMIHFRLKRIEA